MSAQVLRGTKQEIADRLARIAGEVREAIVFLDEPIPATARTPDAEDIFAEMRPYMVNAEHVDDARGHRYAHGRRMILLDTNVLTRMARSGDPQSGAARAAIGTLLARGERLIVVPQNLYEFWAVATRPPGAPPRGP